MPAAFRIDYGKLGDARFDHNGNLIVTGRITRTGVFTYRHQDGSITRELRHPDDVFNSDAVESFIQLPITNNHPPEAVTPENFKRYMVGNNGDTIRRVDDSGRESADGAIMETDLTFRDQKMIDSLKPGDGAKAKREISNGYKADVIPERGTYNGESYDHRQTNIRGNHIAIVDAGRAGSECRLLMDAADAEQIEDATGEGSRGGTIIGHTKSDKPIYEGGASHPKHAKFTAQDHREAAETHRGLLTYGGYGMNQSPRNIRHMREMDSHLEKQKTLRKAGDTSGDAMGKTSTGKTVYDEPFHPTHASFSANEHSEAADMHLGKMQEAEATRSKAENSGNDKAYGIADRQAQLHSNAVDHHMQEAARMHNYNLDGLKFIKTKLDAKQLSGEDRKRLSDKIAKIAEDHPDWENDRRVAAAYGMLGLDKADRAAIMKMHGDMRMSVEELLKLLKGNQDDWDDFDGTEGDEDGVDSPEGELGVRDGADPINKAGQQETTMKIVLAAQKVGKLVLDSITVEVVKEDDIKPLRTRCDTLVVELEKAHKDLAIKEGEVLALKQQSEMSPQRLDELGRERQQVVEVAIFAGLKNDDIATLSNTRIKRMAVRAKYPALVKSDEGDDERAAKIKKLMAEGKSREEAEAAAGKADASDEAVQGMFNVLVADQEKQGKNRSKLVQIRAATTHVAPTRNDGGPRVAQRNGAAPREDEDNRSYREIAESRTADMHLRTDEELRQAGMS